MAAAVPFIQAVCNGRAGSVFTVTSNNHGSRVLRDAIAAWKKGILIESNTSADGKPCGHRTRTIGCVQNAHLLTVAVFSADTGYGGKDVVSTFVCDLGLND